VRARWVGVGGFALLFGFALALLRGQPVAASDQGVYLSIAARMLDGDTLYAEVADPKDPFFFYTYAAALWIADWRGPFLLDGIWLAVASVSIVLLLRALGAPRSAIVAGFFIYPLALTSGWFQPGLSMLAGLAVAPLPAWAWLRGRFAVAGALLGTVMLFKLNLAGIAAASLLGFVVVGAPEGSRRGQLSRGVLGLAVFLAGAAAILGIRGELRAYLDMIAYNVQYARSGLEHLGPVDRARAHLDVVVQYFESAGRWQLPGAVLVLGLFAVAGYLVWTRGGSNRRLLAAGAVLTLLATLGTLALTAFWRHHLQMLAYPIVLIAATGVSAVALLFGRRAGAIAAAACTVFALWSSVKNEDRIDISSAWTTAPHSGGAVALERARMRFHAGDDKVAYIVFGGNSENAHAVFIGDELDLVCRWFHIYPQSLTKYFEETVECFGREDPDLVLVTLGFFDSRLAPPEWAAFVASARRFLDTRYELVETEHPGFEVWRQKPTVA